MGSRAGLEPAPTRTSSLRPSARETTHSRQSTSGGIEPPASGPPAIGITAQSPCLLDSKVQGGRAALGRRKDQSLPVSKNRRKSGFRCWNTAKGHAGFAIRAYQGDDRTSPARLTGSVLPRPRNTKVKAGSSREQAQCPPCHSPAVSASPSLRRVVPRQDSRGLRIPRMAYLPNSKIRTPDCPRFPSTRTGDCARCTSPQHALAARTSYTRS